MIIENSYFEDIKRIFKENNHGYITEESNLLGLTDKNMRQYVLREEDMTLGYIILYIGNDFCKKEDYPDKIEEWPEKVAYIWEIITDQKYAKQKVATKLMEYICNKYKGYWIYSCVDMSNIPSIKLHEKSGFKPLYTFHEKQNNHTTEHVMMRKKNDII